MWMCVGAEGRATINHTMHCNVLKLKKQWFIVYLYSGTRQQDFKKGVQCKKKRKKKGKTRTYFLSSGLDLIRTVPVL